MTSTASQQNPTPASSSTANPSTSYASAAGKKPTQTPLTATGHPPVVVGSAHNAKPTSIGSVNGRPSLAAAVPPVAVPNAPAVVRSSNINGADHTRKGSVMIPSNLSQNGGLVGGAKVIPQFGFAADSPAAQHVAPQPTTSAPISIPGTNARVSSPSHSPQPIPQQSGGQRPPSNTSALLTFGSFPGDDMHTKHAIGQSNMAVDSQALHTRRPSQTSAQGDVGGHGGPGHGRGGFQGSRGGRGGGGQFNHGFNHNNQNNLGFPPRQYSSGPNGGRGGAMSSFHNRGGMQGGFHPHSSPTPSRPSPATTPAMTHGTPASMQPVPLPGNYYPASMYPQHPQVKQPPFLPDPATSYRFDKGPGKRGKARQNFDKNNTRHSQAAFASSQRHQPFNNGRPRRDSRRMEAGPGCQVDINGGQPTPPLSYGDPDRTRHQGYSRHHQQYQSPPHLVIPQFASQTLDLSPESGDFEKLLTAKNKQMNAPYGPPPGTPFDAYGRPMMVPNAYAPPFPPHGMPPYMNQPAPSGPGMHQPYQPQPPGYNQGQPGAQPMSRNGSQVSERPASSASQSQVPPVVVQSAPHLRPAQGSPPVVSSGVGLSRPKKNAAIVIRTPQGEVVDVSAQKKAPASPALSIQQSKTPPVVSSTPTPPTPKSSTPSHIRNESISASKTAEQLRDEFRVNVLKTVEADTKAAEEEAVVKAAAEKATSDAMAQEEERLREQERLAAEAKAYEEVQEKGRKEKAEAEAAAKAKTESEAVAAEKKSEAAAPAAKTKEEELEEEERMIREMEEEDARREKEQDQITARKMAENEAAKEKAEKERIARAAENDRKLGEQEREMERLEEERERKRQQGGARSAEVGEPTFKKADDFKTPDKKEAAPIKPSPAEKRAKPAALNLAPLNTKPVEAPQPSAAIQSLKSARFLTVSDAVHYPSGIVPPTPNPALNPAVAKKGTSFKYDATFLLQFQKVFIEQPSVEFHQQVKSLIGETDRSASARTPATGPGGRGSSRGSGMGGFPPQGGMGNFGAGGQPLPRGTTSEQRFAMSQGALARPSMGGPTPAFSRSGAFPGAPGMSRTPSAANMAIPGSPRQSSRSQRGSKRADFGNSVKQEAQLAKAMPLTAGLDLKPITTSSTGWKPTSIGGVARANAQSASSTHLEPETVQRKVKAALNKMTPEKFDKIASQILEIAHQSKNEQDGRTLRQVIQLTFEKATDEAHWASMYAKFCKRMHDTMSPEICDENILDKLGQVVSGGALFRKYLLNRCQEEFERGWKIDLPDLKEGEDNKPGEAVLMSDEYYIAAAAKRRGLGLVQFIGELYKLGMLTERIMHSCLQKLLEFDNVPDEAEIESLTKLMRTIGANLDNKESHEKSRGMMDAYFHRIHKVIDMPDLPSRLRFMLMDIVDLRKKGWTSKDTNKGPKTLDEIRIDAEQAAAQKAAENQRNNSRGGPMGGRPQGGRGDSRMPSFQQQPNQIGIDELRRLKGSASRSASQNVPFGPPSLFSSRSNSGRRAMPLGRAGEDSCTSSRTGTPPTRSDSIAHTNAFGALADAGDHPASPPSTHASPALSKATPDAAAARDDKRAG